MPGTPSAPILRFASGTLTITGLDAASYSALPENTARFDARSNTFRARACDYAKIALALRAARIDFTDHAKEFAPLSLFLTQTLFPHPHQKTALDAWCKAGRRGVAALPTGSGKTILACMAIAITKRPALVLVPTIDLLGQWAATLERFFGMEVGILGGGSKTVLPITVATYNSAVLQMEFIGSRFALLVADECHHLPGPVNQLAAAMCIAPYRLGLSATPELDPERDAVMTDLLGPVICRVGIDELEGKLLAPYDVRTIELHLMPEERQEYDRNRTLYLDFLHARGIKMDSPEAWRHFVAETARSGNAGKAAFHACLRQRELARNGENKLRQLWELLTTHAGERIIVFTADNSAAYAIGRRYCLPVLTHHTKAAERKAMLNAFRDGSSPVLVSSKVLNEGVDVPEANVAVVFSGGSSIREHVQRLGRVLRAAPGKHAVLYELINTGTSEVGVKERRREHRAYQSKESYHTGGRRPC